MNSGLNGAFGQKERSKERLTEMRKMLAHLFTKPVVRLLAGVGISPNGVTWFGFFLTLAAGLLIIYDRMLISGILVLLAGFCDTLDGALARHTNRVTRYGAVLDSTLDRLSEGLILISILVFYVMSASERPILAVLLTSTALVSSYLVSYVRARAEGLGLACEVGVSTRTERVVVTALGLILNQITLALVIIAILSFITTGQRLLFVWQETKKN